MSTTIKDASYQIADIKFDYETTEEARRFIESMFDMDTKEGQRAAEDLFRIAKIKQRDGETI